MNGLESTSVLPELRADLQYSEGVRELDGSKSYLIFDPLRHQYLQINYKSKRILELWHSKNAGTIVEALEDLAVTLDDIETLLKFVWKASLTVLPPNGDNEFFTKQLEKKKSKPVKRLLHGYLFVRLPLVRPHQFLKKTEPLSRLFFTRTWWLFVTLIALIGLFLTSRQWDQFTHTFSHFFSLQGLVYYALALAFVKCLHELGHGYAATRYGCRVTTMGVALIVLFPVLFTDTTDSWKLTSRRKRLIIGIAGVAVEISIAAIATFLWAILEDGPLRSTAFFVATTSWMMSLLVNLNPLMRFDAYYLLADALGIQNLQSRSFAIGKWSMREILFALGEAPPEAMSRSLRKGLTVLAWATWLYRFFLFLGIALLIHGMVFRPFGTFLAAVEIQFFILIPIINELKQWWLRRSQLVASKNTWVLMTFIIGLGVISLVPWQSTVRIPAVVEAAEQSPLYAPRVSMILEKHVSQGDLVEQGDPIITLGSIELDNQMIAAQRRMDLVEVLLKRIGTNAEDRGQKFVLETELRQWQQELEGLQEQKSLLTVVAPISGLVAELESNLHVGRWINDDTRLGSVVTTQGARIRGYVSASDLSRISEGEKAVFIPDVPEQNRLAGTINVVDSANVDYLTIPELTSHYTGAVAVSKVGNQLKPLKAWYNIHVDVDGQDISVNRSERGMLLTQGEPESFALKFWRRAVQVVILPLRRGLLYPAELPGPAGSLSQRSNDKKIPCIAGFRLPF